MIKPDAVIWPKRYTFGKAAYLRFGFEKLGMNLVPDKGGMNFYHKHGIFKFHVVIDGRKIRVLLDGRSNWRELHDEFLADDAFYFRTHLAKAYKDRHPRLYPMPQCTVNFEILPNLYEMRKQRKGRKDFKYDLFGIFRMAGGDLRLRTLEQVREQKWRSLIGLSQPKVQKRSIPEEFLCKKLSHRQYLEAVSQSRTMLALPGGGRTWLNFRHVEAWGMGACCLTLEEPNVVLLGKPDNVWAGFREDLSNFKEVAEEHMADDAKRRGMEERGIDYFEKHYTPKRHAEHIIKTIEKEIGK